ncbi:MAG: Flap endonuclease 1 [Methanomassiliicoccales archaeon PtaU1.Bin124]|nr:MAG: Flap endonuclease 1 [Methanomassiliicoccales archaeon PtaU1.Bin124]
MGVNLSDLVTFHEMEPAQLGGKTVAIDAYNAIYQFLSVIRQPDGTPLKDDQGRVTSHLAGLLNRNANLIEMGMRPVYVFDGLPSRLKAATIQERHERRAKAQQEWHEAVKAGDTEAAYSKATQSTKITNDIVASSRILLVHLGIPIVQAPGEGEAQAAYMAQKGDVWAASSQDFDSLLFGAPRLLKNLTLAGRRKMPGRNEYRDVKMEMVELEEVLRTLDISREQLIDICILMGTDFNEGIRGIGPKKGLKLIKEHGDFQTVMAALDKEMPEYEQVRDIFLHFEHTDNYSLDVKPPEPDHVIEMLVKEHDFTEARVRSALDKMGKRPEPPVSGKQSRLDMF